MAEVDATWRQTCAGYGEEALPPNLNSAELDYPLRRLFVWSSSQSSEKKEVSQMLYNRKDGDAGERIKILGGKAVGLVDKECYV